jgi:hypothetical protein
MNISKPGRQAHGRSLWPGLQAVMLGGLPAARARLAAVFAVTSGWRYWRRHRWPSLRLWLPLALRLRAAASSSRGRPASAAVSGPQRGGGWAVGPCKARFTLQRLPPGAVQRGVRAAADPASVACSSLQPHGGPTGQASPRWLYCVLSACCWPGCVAPALCALLSELMADACL